MEREFELHVNRRILPVRYRADDERRIIETKDGTIAEVRFRKLPDGRIIKQILRCLREERAPLPRARSLVVIQGGRSV
ncbi:hypothetical protein K2X83_01130 [Patescibacteria group bacterium]|nr:hypothetical protein [Patescibacteria group bacterium]